MCNKKVSRKYLDWDEGMVKVKVKVKVVGVAQGGVNILLVLE